MMATRTPTPAQLAARKRFAEMARNGSLNRKRQIAAKKRKANPDGLYDNINAKRERIAAGSGEKMRRPGTKGAPTDAAFKRSAKTAKPRKSNPARAKPKSSTVYRVEYSKDGKKWDTWMTVMYLDMAKAIAQRLADDPFHKNHYVRIDSVKEIG
jgi:hypothetical protein